MLQHTASSRKYFPEVTLLFYKLNKKGGAKNKTKQKRSSLFAKFGQEPSWDTK